MVFSRLKCSDREILKQEEFRDCFQFLWDPACCVSFQVVKLTLYYIKRTDQYFENNLYFIYKFSLKLEPELGARSGESEAA